MTKKGRKKSKRKQKRPRAGPVYMPMPKLFRDDLTDQERRSAINEMARSFRNIRDDAFATIRRFVSRFDSFHALSVLSAYGLSVSAAKDGVKASEAREGKIHQDHVELLQALVLQCAPEELPREIPRPADIQELWDALIELGRGVDLSQLRLLDLDVEADACALLQEKIRSNTRAIRNWGYYHQVKDIGHRLLAPLGDEMRSALGFAGTELIAVLDSLVRSNETRINAHRGRSLGAIGQPDLPGIVAAYAQAMPVVDCSRLLDYFMENNFTLQQARAFLLAHSDMALVDCFIHSACEVADQSGVAEEQVKAIFRALGMVPGDLKGRDPTKFLLDNPVWTSPWILRSDESIFACIPQAGLSFLFEIIERLVALHGLLKAAWHDRRAAFLEEDVAASLSRALPHVTVWRNVRWKVPCKNQNGETDVFAILGSVAIIVEAKSGAVSEYSRRGAPDRLRSEIRDLLESPALQSQRLLAAIKGFRAGECDLILSQDIDLSKVRYILRMSVTLEDFSTIQSDIGKLQSLGLISKDVEPVPTLCLADLHTVIEILDTPAMFLHYLHRRMQLEGKFSHSSDELDLLGTYLMNGLLLGDKETDGTQITFYRMSEKIDRYMTSLSEGIHTLKPGRHLHKPWMRILDHVLQTRSHRWVEIALGLLDVDQDGQQAITREIRRLVKRHRYQSPAPYLNAVVFTAAGVSVTAIAVVVLHQTDAAHRHNAAKAAVAKAFQDPRPVRCIVLVYDVYAPAFPYNFLMLADRGPFQPSRAAGTSSDQTL